ncbi:MAG: 1-deoxy-D-xylulose-5-phosphate reductoisomerase, partial [Salinivirgaceae bacterium]|nr:1-deoxy-D-xylulose-5-phosphate reductoisomerase [Salinivirgaceae bacterium]
MKKIIVLGSTGSIGTQTLDVVRNNPREFEIVVLTALNSADLLIEQAREFLPKYVVIGKSSLYEYVRAALYQLDIKVLSGCDAISEIVTYAEADIVVTAMVGFAGLVPTIRAIESGKNIALANKETLVVAGNLVMATAQKYGSKILPVDSEHSAIYQCLVGEPKEGVEKIILTASGGPFRKFSKEQ